MKQILFMLLLSAIFYSCQEEKQVDNKPQRLIKLKNMYLNLKKEDLTKFKYVGVHTRYFDVKKQEFIISWIIVYVPNDSVISFNKESIYGGLKINTKMQSKLKRYASFYGLKEENVIDSCKHHLSLLKRIFLDNKLIEVKPNGEITEFYFNVSDRLIYKPDSITIKSKYWQDFFEKGRKFDKNWYYQISDKTLLDIGIYNTNN